MSILRRIVAFSIVALALATPSPARIHPGPLYLFGGARLDRFLGCLNCDRSEKFSVWNENERYGSPAHPHSIWNRDGAYGSRTSPLSPWNPRATKPPLVVDRVGNLYGYFTLDPFHPQRVRRRDSHEQGKHFYFLVWLLDNYDWVITHLDEMRVENYERVIKLLDEGRARR